MFPHFLVSLNRPTALANSGSFSMATLAGEADLTTRPTALCTDTCGCMLGDTLSNRASATMLSLLFLAATFLGDGCLKAQAGFTVLPESILGGRPSTRNLSGI